MSYNSSDATYTDFIAPNGNNYSGNDRVYAPDSAYSIDASYIEDDARNASCGHLLVGSVLRRFSRLLL